MTTLSEMRPTQSLRVTSALWSELVDEATRQHKSNAEMVRHICRWHRREAPGRPRGHEHALRRGRGADKVVTRQVKLDPEDVDYLDAIAARIGCPRNTACILLVLEYLGIPATERPPRDS